MELSTEEKKQYNRHLILDKIGEAGQLKLKAAKVLVIGAGGLSCPIIQYLSAAGVGHIGIIDNDIVEQSNLQRQILFTHDDIGQHKAQVAAEKMAKLNPYVHYDYYVQRLDSTNAIALFEKYDIIVDGSDNFPTRYLVNDAAVITGKTLVFGSIFKFHGQLAVFNYQNGPTYRCLYPEPPAPDEVPNCSDIGVLGVLPGIIGCFQANEVIKIISELGGVLSGKLLSIDALTLKQVILNFNKTELADIKELDKDYPAFCGVAPVSNDIKWEDYQASPTSYSLLDVRTKTERAQRNLGGIHIPLDQLYAKRKYLPKGKKILVYCQSGIRSQNAIAVLKEMKLDKSFFNLKGGVNSI